MNCRAWSYAYEVDKPSTNRWIVKEGNDSSDFTMLIIILPIRWNSFACCTIPHSWLAWFNLLMMQSFYGYTASTIGHESTHGFDDQGRQFDANGNLQNWWTADDLIKFMKQANILVKQFSDFVVLDSLHVNGEASLGENIGGFGVRSSNWSGSIQENRTIQKKVKRLMDWLALTVFSWLYFRLARTCTLMHLWLCR